MKLGLVVEGHGDEKALPMLVRQIANDLELDWPDTIETLRVHRQKVVKPGEIERAVTLLANRVGRDGAILVVLDADDDCPREVGPELLRRAREARSDIQVAVVLPQREYEAWLIASLPSLRGQRGLPVDLTCEEDPQGLPSPKGWLSRRMGTSGYSESLDQPALTARISITDARRASSFDKLVREVSRLLQPMASPVGPR